MERVFFRFIILFSLLLSFACATEREIPDEPNEPEQPFEPVDPEEPVDRLGKIIVGEVLDLGAPLTGGAAYTLMSAVTMQGNINILCVVSSGDPSILNIVNIDNPNACEVLETYEVDVGQVWANVVDSKGNYYFAGYKDGGGFYRYSPNAAFGQRLQKLGTLRGSVTAMTVDDADNVYVTNHLTGAIMRWDIQTAGFINYGRLLAAPEYARSLAYYKGFLYGGGQTNGANFFRFNIATRQMEYLANSPAPSNSVINSYATMKVVDKYLFAQMETGGGNIMSIYDLDAQKWLTYEASPGRFPTDNIDGFVYFASTGSSGQPIKSFNLATQEITTTSVAPLPNYGLRGWGIANLTANAQYSGKIFVSIYATTGDLMFFNFATNSRQRVNGVISGGNNVLHNFAFLGDEFYSNGFLGAANARINVHTGARTTYSMGQCEGMTAYKGKLYAGVYPGARIFEFDPTTNTSTLLFTIGEGQDRPFQMKAFDDKLFIGTISDYGLLGGALSVYDLNTKELSVHRNIIQDQSITGIAYNDGKVYGSSSIAGGIGSAPSQASAKLFVYDVNSKTKIIETTPVFTLATAISIIGDLCFSPDGRLWGVARDIIFEINPETLEIISETKISNGNVFSNWRPVYIFFADEYIMYANPGGNLIAFDTHTRTYKNIAPSAAGRVGFYAANDARDIIVFNNANFGALAYRVDVKN